MKKITRKLQQVATRSGKSVYRTCVMCQKRLAIRHPEYRFELSLCLSIWWFLLLSPCLARPSWTRLAEKAWQRRDSQSHLQIRVLRGRGERYVVKYFRSKSVDGRRALVAYKLVEPGDGCELGVGALVWAGAGTWVERVERRTDSSDPSRRRFQPPSPASWLPASSYIVIT